jgi:hypothetical protein
MLSFATIGGLLLIVGAYFTYKGEILTSVSVYIFADIIWIILGIQSGDFVGAGLIFVGAFLGILAWVKMNSGIFRKNLHKDQKI